MSRIIEKNKHKIILNVASLGNRKIYQEIFGGRGSSPRSERGLERIEAFKMNNWSDIIITKDKNIVFKFRAIEFRTQDWKQYANGFKGLARRDEDRVERIFKKITETELIQFVKFLKPLHLGEGMSFDSDKYFNFSQRMYLNDFDLGLNGIVGIESFFVKMLSQEKRYFRTVEEVTGYGFTRFWFNVDSHEISNFMDGEFYAKHIQLSGNFDKDNHFQAVGESFHECNISKKFVRIFSSQGVEKYLLCPEYYREGLTMIFNGRVVLKEHYNNLPVCPQCSGRNAVEFVKIDDKGIDNEFIVFGGHTSCCITCYNDNMYHKTEGTIRNYGYKPTPIFRSVKNDKIVTSSEEPKTNCYGLEIEVQERESGTNLNALAYEIQRDSDGFLYTKYDSSVDDGFEIVSHPATFNAIKKMDFQKMFLRHRDKLKGYFTRSCGMHIHINRNSFNDLQLYKFVLMLNEYQSLTKAIAQRRRESEYSWANFQSSQANDCKRESSYISKKMKEESKTENGIRIREINKKYKADLRIGERYQVVNLQNANTIEIRCFKSNLDEVAFRKNIEFVDGLFWFCKETPVHDLTVENFLKFVKINEKDYSNLIKFLNRAETQAKLLS